MNKIYLYSIIFFILIFGLGQIVFAEDIKFQGFEGDANDNWDSNLTPASYLISGDNWGPLTSLSTITPNSGSKFWGIQDIENPTVGEGASAVEHTMDFSAR